MVPGAARPTVNDIAREAGVSLATVDRVMNARPGVRAVTVARVHDAIARLGYVRDVAAANLARRQAHRLAFVLPDGPSAVLQALAAAAEGAAVRAALDKTDLRVIRVPPFDPAAVARTLDALRAEGIDGLAVMAPETPQVRDAIRRVHDAGIAVVALVSDQPAAPRDRFVGIDNVRAGRTAGWLLGRFLRHPDAGAEGRVLVLAGSMLSRDHIERRHGFDAVMAERFPGLTVLPSIEGRDDAATVERLLPAALQALAPVHGIYSIGAGNRGLIAVLERMGLAGRLPVVVHDLTPHVRDALRSGTVDACIAQDLGHMVRSALRVLRARIEGTPIDPAQEAIRIEILIRENMAEAPAA
jgi:LacI family transcriptional regulator